MGIRGISIICRCEYRDNKKNITFSPVLKTGNMSHSDFRAEFGCTKNTWMRQRILYFFIIFLSGLSAYSQQTPLITQYMYTQMAFNPGYAGSNEGICATGLVRQMWMGLKGAPQTFLVTIDSPLKFLHGGLGGSIMQDMVADFKTTQVKLGYAYHMDLGTGNLGIGAEIILQNSKLDLGKLKEGAINQEDPLLESTDNKSGDMVVDASIGAFYKVPDKYYIGFSALQLLQTRQKKNGYKLRRTYNLDGGYYWPVPNYPGFELQPSAIIMFDGTEWQTTVNAIVNYNKKLSGGIGFRYQDGVASIPLIFGMAIKSFKIGISYDIGTSGTGINNGGSLEIILNYCFKIETEKFRKSYKNTRFL